MQKSWKKLTISELNKNPELLLPTLYDFKSLGLEQKEDSLEIYFPDNVDMDKLQEYVYQAMKTYKIQGKVFAESLKNENWHLIWKKDFRPIKISNRISITPAWIDPPKNCEIAIKINPGMAFGTGTHATTQMALQLLEENFIPDCKVLDAGCGSGILTVAALKLGAQKVEAWDITKDVKDNFYEHMAINNIEQDYNLKIGDVTSCDYYPFDIILSNIQKNVNIKVLENTSKSGYTGLIIFTGILQEEDEEFTKALVKNGKQIIQKLRKKEWIAFVVQ
ncbi:MAG: 50S ribosomal protein L11 methyltransferase [Candidatus Marinimicrobia bacterium]|nr:50S ribosomal protein L11 methyltransferase [Candidatus Neomarinimicrobiota bacterium]